MINVLKICIIIGIAVFNEETFSGKQTLHKMRPRYFATYEDSPPPPTPSKTGLIVMRLRH